MARKGLRVTRNHTQRRQRDSGGTPQVQAQADGHGHDHSNGRPPVVRSHHGRSIRIQDPGCRQAGGSPDGEKGVGGRVYVGERVHADGGSPSGEVFPDWKQNLRALVRRRSQRDRRLPTRRLRLRRPRPPHTRYSPYLVLLRRGSSR